MRLLRHLQHWLTGTGRPLRVADFVPETHPVRQWADTFPWSALVATAVKIIARNISLFGCDTLRRAERPRCGSPESASAEPGRCASWWVA